VHKRTLPLKTGPVSFKRLLGGPIPHPTPTELSWISRPARARHRSCRRNRRPGPERSVAEMVGRARNRGRGDSHRAGARSITQQTLRRWSRPP